MNLHAAVRRWWEGEGGVLASLLRLAAAPLEGLFRVAVFVRGRLYVWGLVESTTAPIPVVSVGNLTVGGTGKTPIVRWVVESLRDAGARPAVIVRGFADEVALHRRWYPSVPVVEDTSRARGSATAAAGGCSVAVLDDGFQHRRLRRDLDIVVVAVNDTGPVRLLPRGPYRETPKALRRADLILLSDKGRRGDPDAQAATDRAREWARRWAPDVPVHHVRLSASGWQNLDGSFAERPGGPVLGVAGIGAPDTFRHTLQEELSEPVEVMDFPDHQRYDHNDMRSILERAAGRTVVVTEKDAVKLARFPGFHPMARVLALDVESVEGEEQVREILRSVAGL